MNDLPTALLATISEEAQAAVSRWWANLADSDRGEVQELWDERGKRAFFAPQADEAGLPDSWEAIPQVIGGRFIPHDDAIRMHEWLQDWHEYCLTHDVAFLPREVIVIRTFHICRSHPIAQAVVAAGHLPAEFSCPFASASCPMHNLQTLAPDQALALLPARAGGWWIVASASA